MLVMIQLYNLTPEAEAKAGELQVQGLHWQLCATVSRSKKPTNVKTLQTIHSQYSDLTADQICVFATGLLRH